MIYRPANSQDTVKRSERGQAIATTTLAVQAREVQPAASQVAQLVPRRSSLRNGTKEMRCPPRAEDEQVDGFKAEHFC